MNLETLLKTFDYKISDGTEYLWKSYPSARYIDLRSEFAEAQIVFSTIDQTIYETSISSDEYLYRWRNPEFIAAHDSEAKSRDIDPSIAWDDVKYIDLEVESDFLEKAKAVFNGSDDFDKRIEIELDLPEDEIFQLAMMAHKKDITLNQLLTDLIVAACNISVNEKA